VISSSQRHLPDSTQQSQRTIVHSPSGISAAERPQTLSLDRANTGTGKKAL